jgi:hypothetical protein
MLVGLATLLSAVSFLSGIAAVGSGRHFQFRTRDIFLGRQNALLYVWVIFSSIFSMGHCTALLRFGLTWHWMWKDGETGMWMALHSFIAALLIAAHFYIKRNLGKRLGT